MPRYTFNIDDDQPNADESEDFANDQAAMDHAKNMALEFARSLSAIGRTYVVVRNERRDEIGQVLLAPPDRSVV